MPEITKNCRICGKQITVKNNWYCLCGNPECKKSSQRNQQQQFNEKLKSDPAVYAEYLAVQKMKRRIRNNGKTICKLCGKPIFRNINVTEHIGGKKMHPQCVVSGVAELIKSGERIDFTWKSRLYAYGYDVTAVREMVETGEYY